MHAPSAAVLAALLMSPPAMAAPAPADGTIQRFEDAQQAAWNAHDAPAYAAAFAADADVISSLGWRWRGQADVARNLGDGFKLVYAGAHLQLTAIEPRPLGADLMSVTLLWTIEGSRTVRGEPATGTLRGYETQVLRRTDAGWTILVQQDTAIASPQPPAPQYAPAPATGAATPAPTGFPTTPPPVRRCFLARANGDCLIYGKAKRAQPN